MKKLVVDNCKLCGKHLLVKPQSHIIPKMFYNEIKKGTGNIRQHNNPNLAVQDGLKNEYLCVECETLFSKYETTFSKQYTKIVNGSLHEIDCTNELKYFSLTLFWRMLSYTLDEYKINPSPENGGFSDEEIYELEKTRDYWNKKLNEKCECDYSDIDGYVVFTDSITSIKSFPSIANNYYVDGCVRAYGEKNKWVGAYVYILVPHLLFICKLWGKDEILKSNNINKNKVIKARNTQLPKFVTSYFQKIMLERECSINKLSSKQQKIINERCERAITKQ